jgi:ABC-2 type transport system ATP-binding protein
MTGAHDAPVIEVRDLVKRYGSVTALDGVSLDVRRGEIFALLGPNGAGKTTLLEILEGHRTPTSGTATVFGVVPAEARADLRERIGIVPQSASFELYLTVREHLALFAGYYRKALPVDDVIALVGLEAKRDTRVGRLSGGQQRRLDLALAMIGDPELILLDEPTTGLDVEIRDRIWDLVRRLRDAGKTILLTTHNLHEAEVLSDRVGVIAGGRLAAVGRPSELLDTETAAKVSFNAEALATAALPADLAERAQVVADVVTIDTRDSTRTLHALTCWALEHGVVLRGLEVRRPNLEEIYLAIVASQTATADSAVSKQKETV